MSRLLSVLGSVLLLAGSAQAAGLLIPEEKKLPPLGLVSQQVTINIEDQAAVTRVEQVFRNHTDRALEATYVFPVPKGASVREFAMWVNGAKMAGQLMEATEAREIYTDIVQRTQDPGLLEYMEGNLFRLKVFPVPAKGEQKISLSYTSVAESDHGTIEYRYPLKTDARALETLDKFGLEVKLKSQHRLQSIYSPSHAVTITRASDHEARVTFENKHARLDKDFQLYYTTGDKDVGLTALTQRPHATRDGYFMLLISPRAELSKEQQTPRDLVFVLDTSGSMAGKRIEQARNALKFCLRNLNAQDRFTVMHFANTVNKYSEMLENATADNIDHAGKWVERFEATGGTAIQAALNAALEMRPKEADRTFTIVFFTDGKPTVGETNARRIQEGILAKNSSNTRIFTFGVGDDVNATLLDALADQSRAVSTYVRESEDIEERVSNFYSKINHPVFTNLRLTVGPDVKLAEVYPPELPDLFHGTQLVVLGRYSGHGTAAVKLAGNLGKNERDFTYQVAFPEQAREDKSFVEDLWARRKVGHLLDQIRRNGELTELKEEVIRLAKRHGITTPYTSYLVAPDDAVSGKERARQEKQPGRLDVRFNLAPTGNMPPVPATNFNHGYHINPGSGFNPYGIPAVNGPGSFGGFGGGFNGMFGGGGYSIATQPAGPSKDNPPKAAATQFAPRFTSPQTQWAVPNANFDQSSATRTEGKAVQSAGDSKGRGQKGDGLDEVRRILAEGRLDKLDSGKAAIDLAEYLKGLRTGSQVEQTAIRTVNGRTCFQIDSVWIDEGFTDKLPTLRVKALGKAYFRMLERQPALREVFALGNHLIWVTPNGTALIIDLSNGREEVPDDEIDRLFARQ